MGIMKSESWNLQSRLPRCAAQILSIYLGRCKACFLQVSMFFLQGGPIVVARKCDKCMKAKFENVCSCTGTLPGSNTSVSAEQE